MIIYDFPRPYTLCSMYETFTNIHIHPKKSSRCTVHSARCARPGSPSAAACHASPKKGAGSDHRGTSSQAHWQPGQIGEAKEANMKRSNVWSHQISSNFMQKNKWGSLRRIPQILCLKSLIFPFKMPIFLSPSLGPSQGFFPLQVFHLRRPGKIDGTDGSIIWGCSTCKHWVKYDRDEWWINTITYYYSH